MFKPELLSPQVPSRTCVTPTPMAPMPSMPANPVTACGCATTIRSREPAARYQRSPCPRQAVLRGGQHSAPQLQTQDLYPRHASGGGDEAGCADHVRPRSHHDDARSLPRHADPPLGTGQRGQLGHGEVLASDGPDRVILSRELSLDEIEEIRMQVPEMELEVFVHGALCMAYPTAACSPATSTSVTPTRAPAPTPAAGSTRCTKARKMTWARSSTVRSPSPSARTTPWSWQTDRCAGAAGRVQPPGRVHERVRRRARHLHHELQGSARGRARRATDQDGRALLKIEGRTKSFYYCARTAQVYRKAIDDAVATYRLTAA